MNAAPQVERCGRTGWQAASDPSNITASIETLQVQRAVAHVPMIYLVAVFNLVAVMALCAHDGIELRFYGWMGVFAVACLARMAVWVRLRRSDMPVANPKKLIRNLTVVSVSIITFLSIWSVFAISTDMFANQVLIPMSLVFGSTCIAHCLASVKKAAVAVLVVGVTPSALTMIMFGDFDQVIMGSSMITIEILMIRFIIDSYNQIVSGLHLRQTIWHQAHSDPLTSLANRRAMMMHLEQASDPTRSGADVFSVALMDLNAFKQVNDTLGHDIGDDLLVEVAQRLERSRAEHEVVGRLGGDEFLIFMPGVGTADAAMARATAYLSSLAKPVTIKGHVLTPSASIGVAVQGLDGQLPADILKAADQALYAMKRSEKITTETGSKKHLRAA